MYIGQSLSSVSQETHINSTETKSLNTEENIDKELFESDYIQVNLMKDIEEEITLDSLQTGIWGQLDGQNINEIRSDYDINNVKISDSFKKIGNLADDFDWQRQWLQGDALDIYFSNADHLDFKDIDNSKSGIFVFQNTICEEKDNYIKISDDQYLLPMNLNVPGPSQAVGGAHMLWSLWNIKDTSKLEFQKNSPLVLSGGASCGNKPLVIKENDSTFIMYKGVSYVDDGGEAGSIVLLKINNTDILFKNVYDFNYSWSEDGYSLQKEFTFDYSSNFNEFVIKEETKKSNDRWQNWESENNIIKVELF